MLTAVRVQAHPLTPFVSPTTPYLELTNELELAEVTAEPSGLTLEGALDMLREGPVRKYAPYGCGLASCAPDPNLSYVLYLTLCPVLFTGRT